MVCVQVCAHVLCPYVCVYVCVYTVAERNLSLVSCSWILMILDTFFKAIIIFVTILIAGLATKTGETMSLYGTLEPTGVGLTQLGRHMAFTLFISNPKERNILGSILPAMFPQRPGRLEASFLLAPKARVTHLFSILFGQTTRVRGESNRRPRRYGLRVRSTSCSIHRKYLVPYISFSKGVAHWTESYRDFHYCEL